MWLKLALVGLFVSVHAFAQVDESDVVDTEEQRLEKVRSARSLEEAVDNMTPDEIAELLGLPSEAEFTEMLQSDPELLFTTVSSPVVHINVSISRQRLEMSSPDGFHVATTSTARKGKVTKTGCHSPERMHKKWKSTIYGSPMPNAIFYYGPYAIHGTFEENKLGKPASAGCVRVSRADAAHIFGVVSRYGMSKTRVCVCRGDCNSVALQ